MSEHTIKPHEKYISAEVENPSIDKSHSLKWYSAEGFWHCPDCGHCLCHHKQKLTEECQPRTP